VHIPRAKVATPSGWGTDHTIFKDYIAQDLLLSTFAAYAITRAIEAPGKHKKQRGLSSHCSQSFQLYF
jgi:hypothetical protein